MKKIFFTIFYLLALHLVSLAQTKRVDLADSMWLFTLDPIGRGEVNDWHKSDPRWDGTLAHPAFRWDTVGLPHDFLSDPAYGHTGKAWYRRSFELPESGADASWILAFERVFQRCRVWVNGTYVGSHEGGYTPFTFPVQKYLKFGQQNFIAVEVDNTPKLRALPGVSSGKEPNMVMYPWMGYGGILGAVELLKTSPVRVASQRITTTKKDGEWVVAVNFVVKNDSGLPSSGEIIWELPKILAQKKVPYEVPANSTVKVSARAEIPTENVAAWSVDTPVLYQSKAAIAATGDDGLLDNFGFREIEIKDAQFLINGTPVRLAGANRAIGHPRYGGVDADELIAQDMQLMKAAGMTFSRLQHTAPRKYLLDWADENGFLLVLEVGMWGYPSEDMASAELREQFKAEMAELIALAQNHPSVVGWSLGNEYESWTSEGIAWTKDMAAFVKTLDATRPVTFAALARAFKFAAESAPESPQAFDYVDYISGNFYLPADQFAAYFDPVHLRWPTKPIAVTEFGLRVDQVENEAVRIRYFDTILSLVRERPWICGLSFWSFNDYQSRYPGTGKDGYRRWGLVDEYRVPRALYHHAKQVLQGGLDAQ